MLAQCYILPPYNVAYNSSHYNTTFHLGPTFLSHIDGDTLDLVSILDDLIVGSAFIVMYRNWLIVVMKEFKRSEMARPGAILTFLITTVKAM